MLLADEINRTPPKTQSALLEAMQEHRVTARGKTHALDAPFVVLATQNPIELEGTYPLPEAQLDRFVFNVVLDYLDADEEAAVVQRNVHGVVDEEVAAHTNADAILAFQRLGARGADGGRRHAPRGGSGAGDAPGFRRSAVAGAQVRALRGQRSRRHHAEHRRPRPGPLGRPLSRYGRGRAGAAWAGAAPTACR